MYGHREQSLRNQLKRHFPQLLAERDRIRSVLGMNQYPQRGEREKTKARYAQAPKGYCNTDEPLKQIAERMNLRPSSLYNFLTTKFPQAVAKRRKAQQDKDNA